MKAPPYFPFFQRDFVHSCRSERMAPEEIGALVMLMCQQWETMGPVAVEPERFAAYTGWDIRLARRLLARLVSLEKVDRSEAGIQSGRMAEEITKYCARVKAAEDRERKAAEQREAAAEAARLADEMRSTSSELVPNYSEMSGTSSSDLPENRNDINNGATREAALPDIRYQNHRSKTPIVPLSGDDPIPAQFETWWQAYPTTVRKVGKGECLALYRQAITGQRRPGKRRQKILDRETTTAAVMLAAVQRYAATKPDPEYVPAPARWLNEGRWLDEHQPAAGAATSAWWQDPAQLAACTDARWRAGIAAHANGTWPTGKLGPPPGDHRCVVPKHLIAELRLTDRYTPAGISRDKH